MKGKVLRETSGVALDRLIEGLRVDAVEAGEIGIEHDALVADVQDTIGKRIGIRVGYNEYHFASKLAPTFCELCPYASINASFSCLSCISW